MKKERKKDFFFHFSRRSFSNKKRKRKSVDRVEFICIFTETNVDPLNKESGEERNVCVFVEERRFLQAASRSSVLVSDIR